MNGYEIRLELLKLAQSIESERIWAERQRLEQDWQTHVEQSRAKEWSANVPFPLLPTVTHDDIISVAEKLNKFISS